MSKSLIARCQGEGGSFNLTVDHASGTWEGRSGWLEHIQFVNSAGTHGLLALQPVPKYGSNVISKLTISGSEAIVELQLRSMVHGLEHNVFGPSAQLMLIFRLDANKQAQNQASPFVSLLQVKVSGSSNGKSLPNFPLADIGKIQPVKLTWTSSSPPLDPPPAAAANLILGLSDDDQFTWLRTLFVGFHTHTPSEGPTSFGLAVERVLKLAQDHRLTLPDSAGRGILRISLNQGTSLRLCQAQPHGWASEAWDKGRGALWFLGLTTIPPSALAASWNGIARERYYPALDLIRGDRPFSLLPELHDVLPEGTGEHAATLLVGMRDSQPGKALRVDPADVRLQQPALAGLAAFRGLLDDAGPKTGAYKAKARFERMRDHAGATVLRAMHLEQPPPDREKLRTALGLADEQTQPLATLHFLAREVTDSTLSLAAPVRIGAFDLVLPEHGAEAPGDEQSSVKLWLTAPRAGATGDACPHAELTLSLGLADFAPGSQDAPELEQVQSQRARPKPVLFDLAGRTGSAGTGAAPPVLSLRVTESAFPDDRQKVGLIVRSVGDLPGRDVVVLDTAPFLLAQVTLQPLVATGEGNALAEFQSDSVEGTGWTITAARTGYDVLLPPQAVGESQPKLSQVNGQQPELTPPNGGKQFADFRFSPAARLRLFTTFRGSQRAAVEPPTNTRRIFGDASQRAPGAPLREGRLELLYGLEARVERDDLLVTELTAELGLLPSRITAERPPWRIFPEGSVAVAYGKFQGGWNDVHTMFDRRLAVLSLRQLNRLAVGRATSDEEPKLTNGVSFALRAKAEIRRPVPLPAGAEGTPYAEDGGREALGVSGGLAGGADWGFESAEIYRSLWRKAQPSGFADDLPSDAGELADIHLSALGGWGYQKALFDNRRTSIISRAGMGRTHFYSIERVGRIACFWNRCKHVIVYERTVERSPQFPGQAELAGRPLLRKVREFVEVLEPERRFPDLIEDPARAGPMRACRFRTTIIPVDSTWGQDVPGEGWKVPLWRPDAAAVGAVYANPPQVELELACDRASGAASTRFECYRPEQLWFFASTRPELDDRTDRWPSVVTVDCGVAPMPAPPEVDSQAAEDPDRRIPSAAPTEPGFELFTFDIRPLGEQAVDVMAERAGSAVSTLLRNITVVRAAKLTDPTGTAGQASLTARAALQIKEQVEQQLGRFRAELDRLDGEKLSEAAAARLKAELKQVQDAIKAKATAKLGELVGNYADSLDKIDPCKELQAGVAAALDAAAGRLTSAFREALDDLCRDLVDDLANDQVALLRLLEPWFARAKFLVQQAGNALVPLKGPLDQLQAFDPKALLKLELERAVAELAAVSPRGAAALSTALDRLAASLLLAVDGALDRLVAELSRRMPGAKGRIDKERAGVRGRLAQELDAAVREAKKRIATGQAQLAQVVRELSRRIDEAINDQNGFGKLLADLSEAAKELVQAVGTPLASIDAALRNLTGKVDTAWNEVQEIIATAPAEDRIARARARAKALVDELTAAVAGHLKEEVAKAVKAICDGGLLGGAGVFGNLLKNLPQDLDAVLAKLGNDLLQAGKPLAGVLDALEGAVRRHVQDLRTGVDGLVDAIRGELPDLGQLPDIGLNLTRAFGEAPRVPGLDFNREQIAYYFDTASRLVDLTPVSALVDRVGQDLKAFGMRMPTLSLGDGAVPDLKQLEQFDIGTIFPDFAGIRLDGLFKNLKLPSLDPGRLKVRHGIDPQTRRGWLDARVDTVPLGKKAPLFELGPVGLLLEDGRFDASARLEAGEDGAFSRRAEGEIRGDWVMGFGGQTLVRFADTPLTFDDKGRLSFDIRPEKVRLEETIKFLESFISALGDEEGGLKTSLLKEKGLPVGISCDLDLPVPPLTFGAFGISGLRFATGMQLSAYPEFAIATRLALGSETEPFTLTVCILGGAGWLEARALYKPLSGELATDLSLAIGASAMLGINLSLVRGSVQIFFGINAELHTRSRAAARTTIRLVLLIRGSVVVIGILHACLELLLVGEMSDGRVTGRGSARFTIKFCFFKKTVEQRIEVKLAGGGAGPFSLAEQAEPWLKTLI